MRRIPIPLVLTLAVLPGPASAQSLTPDQHDGIAAIFADLDDPASPGASVSVIRDGEIVYSEGFGSAQLEYGIPVGPTTIFHVASVSKQFTAMAVLLLVADGELSLDDDIREYLDWVPDLGAVITPRHLLSHTSGVRDQWELLYTAGWRMDDVITKEDIRRLMSKQRELNFEPGSRNLYSNMGYSLAAELVQAVSGQPFDAFVKERIFDPLGMTRTHAHDDHEHIVEGRAYSYRAFDGGFRNAVLSFANHGATSLFTTSEDLVRWLDNFRTGAVGGSMLEEMTTRTHLNDGEEISYGLGVVIGDYRGRAMVQHGGSDAGFRSQVIWFPDDRVGIAVLSNLASSNPGLRARQVADVVLDEVLAPVEAEVEEEEGPAPAVEREIVELAVEALERFVGWYSTRMGTAVFEIRDGDLWLTIPNEVRLLATSDTSFVADDEVAATFDFAVEGEVATELLIVQGEELRLEGERIDASAMPDLSTYTGTYYSPEIETLYQVWEGEAGLVLYNLRRGEMALRMVDEDAFAGGDFFARELRFVRDDDGAVEAFLLSGSRVRNHRFFKLKGALPGG